MRLHKVDDVSLRHVIFIESYIECWDSMVKERLFDSFRDFLFRCLSPLFGEIQRNTLKEVSWIEKTMPRRLMTVILGIKAIHQLEVRQKIIIPRIAEKGSIERVPRKLSKSQISGVRSDQRSTSA